MNISFIKSLFKNDITDRPEDYPKLYFRWDREGKEYGPLFFDDMLTREWSGLPIEGRFENESKWKEYSYFQKILNVLKVSKEQVSEMTKMGLTEIDPNMSFIAAVKVIELKNEELRKQREEERVEKDKLPATKQNIKKLIDLGIEYDKNITGLEAKELLSYHKNKEHLSEIFKFLKTNNFHFVEQFTIDAVIKRTDDNLPTLDQFEEIFTSLKSLLEYNINFKFPDTLNKVDMEKLINCLNDAEFEATDIVDQLKSREIIIGDDEFKVIGKLPQNQLKKIRTHIIKNYLSTEWNADKDLIKVIGTFLPEIILKKIEY